MPLPVILITLPLHCSTSHTHAPGPLLSTAPSENEVDISLAIRPGGNVVQVYGICVDAPDGKLRIVLELCAYGSLRAHLKALPRDKVLHTGWHHMCICLYQTCRVCMQSLGHG